MIKTIIVDDDKSAILLLETMLNKHCPNVQIIGTFDSSIDVLKAIKINNVKPDLLFLDIHMDNGDINGLELLQILDLKNSSAIFVTAHTSYMRQALRLNALDFLEKPLDKNKLIEAVSQFKPHLDQITLRKQIESAIELSQSLRIGLKTKIALKEGNKTLLIDLINICHCNSDGNFTFVFLDNGRRLHSNFPLIYLEEILPKSHFFRCHREYIINGLHLKEFNKSEGGSITTTNGVQIPVSRGKRNELFEFIKNITLNDDI